MNGSDLEQLLRATRKESQGGLPPEFSSAVLQRARVVDAVRAYWRVLLAGSLAAIFMAGWIGFHSARGEQAEAPPVLSEFQERAGFNALRP